MAERIYCFEAPYDYGPGDNGYRYGILKADISDKDIEDACRGHWAGIMKSLERLTERRLTEPEFAALEQGDRCGVSYRIHMEGDYSGMLDIARVNEGRGGVPDEDRNPDNTTRSRSEIKGRPNISRLIEAADEDKYEDPDTPDTPEDGLDEYD